MIPSVPYVGSARVGSDPSQVWAKYCSFLDLSQRDFRDIQEELLLEQVGLARASPLGRHLLRTSAPGSVAEFRSRVPLSTYGDYLPYLQPGNDDVLSEKPAVWVHTTGAQAGFKWIPYTRRGLERLLDNLMAVFIMAAASRRGDVRVWPGDTVLYNAPERPYLSGVTAFGMAERFGFRGVLDPETSEHLDFKERVRLGFKEALGKRVDVIISMTSVLSKVGEGFAEQSRQTKLDPNVLRRPRALYRCGKAYVMSKMLRRPVLPEDLWPAKAIVGWGIDTPFFREKVHRYWGKYPFEIYACTEGGIMGMQTWGETGLVFSPYADFFEFIPEEESLRSRADSQYQPQTILLDEVEPGKTYEVVITSFYGMPFIRYRVGHLVQFIPRQQGQAPSLVRFTFLGRADDRIDLAGFTRIDEKTMWEALDRADLKCDEWTVRKEFEAETPILHLYLEVHQPYPPEEVEHRFHQALKVVDPFYGDLETLLGIQPLRVTCLASGTFDRFYDERRAEGSELGRLRPPHMNASDEDMRELLGVAGAV